MKLLFIGDIVGKPGRQILRRAVPLLVARSGIDLVIANVENAAGGFGITPETAREILNCGVHVMTTGNHVWDKKEAMDYIANEPRLLRPLNYPATAPGQGVFVATVGSSRVAVLNAMGRVHMPLVDDPFAALSKEIARMVNDVPVMFVDFHAEVTSEKMALGWFLDGRVSAVVGTHTHVQTADDRVLPRGTAYLTDVGMTGPHDSVIGISKEAAIARFTTGLPSRFDTAVGAPRLHGVVITVDADTGRAQAIERLSLADGDLDALAAAGEVAAGRA
ncbi:MAG: TIGR00282 family metallophosphoesterase [Vicinamibacterales bacterium]